MSKKARDFLFFAFIIVFLIMTVLTSLYASGYKFNLSWPLKFNRILQKTGMLNVSTLPKNANIFLNEKQAKKSAFSVLKKDFITTPAKIKNVLPGEYTLRLEKDGYWPLEKKIKINSGQTTFMEDINLFRSDLPLLLYQYGQGLPIISANGKYLYLSGNGKIINLKDGSELPFDAGDNIDGHWIKNGGKLFAGGKILDTDRNNEINFTNQVGQGFFIWHYSNVDDRVYYANKDSINRLEYDNRTISTIIKGEEYLDYEPKGDMMFAIVKTGNKIFLKKYNAKNGEKIGELEMPTIGEYQFKEEKNNHLVIYDKKNLALYFINPDNLQDTISISGIKSWSWIENEEIIYNTDWEINTFDLTTGKTTLITRVSEIIGSIVWHKEGRYFIFSTDTSLNASNLQENTTLTIFKAEKISFPVLDEDNDLLYFYAKIGQQEGIYKMILQ